MSKYIDTKELFKRINACHIGNPTFKAFSESDIAEMILDTPAAEVEEVVRCKDCKYLKYLNGLDGKTSLWCTRLRTNILKADFFCASGRRKKE